MRLISALLAISLLCISSCYKYDNPLDPENAIPQVATPTFNPAGGYYTAGQTVTISCSTSGAVIYYTTDGSDPTESSTQYSTPFAVVSTTTVKARAYMSEWAASSIAIVYYIFQIATPTFNPPGGDYSAGQTVTISCSTSGAVIYYTTDGSDPTESSTQYSTPISVSSTTTIKAKAYKNGWTPSSIASAIYTITMVYVTGGTFNNGSSDVTINSFYIDKYELTQAGYQAVMGTNPSYFTGVTNGPVEEVTWFNSIEYCNKRSMLEGLSPCYSYLSYDTNPDNWPSGWNTSNANHTNISCNWSANGYRLPTEAEWEFAARGGNQTHNYTYSGSNNLNEVGWYNGNSGGTTHTVGTKASNEMGTFDMSGNVWEWCWDIYGSYPSGDQTDPHGATSGSYRVLRGGSWDSYAGFCTVSNRYYNNATYSSSYAGFRVCKVSP